MNAILIMLYILIRDIKVTARKRCFSWEWLMVAICSEPWINLVAQLFWKNEYSVNKVPPVSTHVSPVSDFGEVGQCGVFISQLVLNAIQHSLQLNSPFKSKNISVCTEEEANWKLSSVSGVSEVDQCGSQHHIRCWKHWNIHFNLIRPVWKWMTRVMILM